MTDGIKMITAEDEEEEFPASPESEPSRKRRKRTTTPKKSPEVGTCPLCARTMKIRTLLKHIEGCNGGVVTRCETFIIVLLYNEYTIIHYE